MTRDDIIQMAREAEIYLPLWEDGQNPDVDPPYAHTMPVIPPLLKRFAELVAAAEVAFYKAENELLLVKLKQLQRDLEVERAQRMIYEERYDHFIKCLDKIYDECQRARNLMGRFSRLEAYEDDAAHNLLHLSHVIRLAKQFLEDYK